MTASVIDKATQRKFKAVYLYHMEAKDASGSEALKAALAEVFGADAAQSDFWWSAAADGSYIPVKRREKAPEVHAI